MESFYLFLGLVLNLSISSETNFLTILGYRWYPLPDLLSINITEVNFNKRKRGVKAPNTIDATTQEGIGALLDQMPHLTRRQVTAKCGELYDPLGIIEPYVASLKRSLTKLNHLDWNDKLLGLLQSDLIHLRSDNCEIVTISILFFA